MKASESFIEASSLSEEAIQTAKTHVRDILSLVIHHTAEQNALVIFDSQCTLALTLTEAYKRCLPHAAVLDFYATSASEITASFKALSPADLVVLIQSTSFRLNAFRLRVELFEQALKVIEHPHLSSMSGVEEMYYIESLAYDPIYFHGVGHALKKKIDEAQRGVVDSGGEYLMFDSPFELAKLNIGDYSTMKNVGGQFPIGEVFTEARDLEAVHGRVRIFAFGDTTFSVNTPSTPITLIVNKGRVIEVEHSTSEFDKVLANIRADEGEVWLRELGFGLNKAFSQHKLVKDIGTYERMCGIHLSLGAKHGVYKKPQFRRKDTWHHVDVFAITHLVYLDEEVVYQEGAWLI
jgi:hypothetical protein